MLSLVAARLSNHLVATSLPPLRLAEHLTSLKQTLSNLDGLFPELLGLCEKPQLLGLQTLNLLVGGSMMYWTVGFVTE